MAGPTEEQILVRAHQLWEAAESPDGWEGEFWYEAERELRDGATYYPDEKSSTFLE